MTFGRRLPGATSRATRRKLRFQEYGEDPVHRRRVCKTHESQDTMLGAISCQVQRLPWSAGNRDPCGEEVGSAGCGVGRTACHNEFAMPGLQSSSICITRIKLTHSQVYSSQGDPARAPFSRAAPDAREPARWRLRTTRNIIECPNCGKAALTPSIASATSLR